MIDILKHLLSNGADNGNFRKGTVDVRLVGIGRAGYGFGKSDVSRLMYAAVPRLDLGFKLLKKRLETGQVGAEVL